jgi:hypothetical protein
MMLGATFATGVSGCRSFARRCADKEVAEVLGDKDRYDAWKIENYHIYPDPRARFADPTDPDRPPMPPDDPAAYMLSPNPQSPKHVGVARVDGKGYLDLLAAWDAENRAAREAEQKKVDKEEEPVGSLFGTPGVDANEAMRTSVSSTKTKNYLITLEQAVELGMFNSREYQDRRENLYLVALPVTAERFAFAAQFFATEQAIYTYAGRLASPGGFGIGTTGGLGSGSVPANPATNQWALNSNVGFAKLFPTGAVLLYRVANQTVFNLSSGAHQSLSSISNMSLDIAQPLLRGGGRAVTLEPLTQAERNLLYEIRNFARFRKEFFVSIAGGGGGSISGASFQASGVIASTVLNTGAFTGFSPLAPGNLIFNPTPGLLVTPGTSGRTILTAELTAPVSGYLGTNLQFAQIDIDKANIANLEGFLKRFYAIKEGGDVSQLQVDQVEQQLLRGRTNLLTDEQQYYDAIERFKLQLGIPTDTPIELDDAPLRPILGHFRRYELVFKQLETASASAEELAKLEDVSKVRAALLRLFTTSPISRGTRFRDQIGKRWSRWEKVEKSADQAALKKQMKELADEHERLVNKRDQLELKNQTLSPAENARLKEIEFELGLANLELQLRFYEDQRDKDGRAWKERVSPDAQRRARVNQFHYVLNAFLVVLTEARNERLDLLKQNWPKLPSLCVNGRDLLEGDVDEAYDYASRVALVNRLDLMNVRAQLVDAWRQIAIFANALLGTFNVDYNLSTSTPTTANRPLAFGGSHNKHTVSLNTELPLVRLNERNSYRAALIGYQRQRRSLMEAEDLVIQIIRGDLRQLRILAENYKIQQRQVELAYLTVESSLESLVQPPQPTGGATASPIGGGATGGATGGTTGTTGGAQAGGGATAGGGGAGGGGFGGAGNAAALTNQLLQAQNSLVIAQNGILTVWINYQNTRFQLYRDLELMPLDSRGVWNDDNASCDLNAPQPVGAGVPGAPSSEAPEPERLPKPLPQPPSQGPGLGNTN